MKTKNIMITVCCVILSAFLLGAAGILKMTNETPQESSESDRLIGVLITREYLDLFNAGRFLSDNVSRLAAGGKVSESESAKYQGRLYASPVETVHTDEETGEVLKSKEYVFSGVDGIRLFAPYIRDESGSYQSAYVDEGITDGKINFQSTDEGENVSLKGTIFVAPDSNSGQFYFNPVYQTADGEVYAVSGSGVFGADESPAGASWSTKISGTQETASGDTITSSGTEVEVTVCFMDGPAKIALLQFNGKNELLDRTEYRPGTLPEHIDALADTQYMIMETSTSEGQNRTLFQREDDFLYAFYCRSDGICVKQESGIGWNGR